MDMHRPIVKLTTAKKLRRLRHFHSSITGPPKQRHTTPAGLILPIHHIHSTNAPTHSIPHLVVRSGPPDNTVERELNSPSRTRRTEQDENKRSGSQDIKATRKKEEKGGAPGSTRGSQGPSQAHIKYIYRSRAAPAAAQQEKIDEFHSKQDGPATADNTATDTSKKASTA